MADFTDIPLSEVTYNKDSFKCDLLVPSSGTTTRPIKIVINAEKISLLHPSNLTVLEEWPFYKIRSWSAVNHWFGTNELILDLTPYHDQPLTIASDQVLHIATSLRVAIAKRAKEIREGITSPKELEFNYSGVQKINQKIKKRVIVELSKVGVKVTEDHSDSLLSILSSGVIVQKSLVEIRTCKKVSDDKFVLDFGSLDDQCLFQHPQPVLIVESFKKFCESKLSGERISTESSEDPELDNI